MRSVFVLLSVLVLPSCDLVEKQSRLCSKSANKQFYTDQCEYKCYQKPFCNVEMRSDCIRLCVRSYKQTWERCQRP